MATQPFRDIPRVQPTFGQSLGGGLERGASNLINTIAKFKEMRRKGEGDEDKSRRAALREELDEEKLGKLRREKTDEEDEINTAISNFVSTATTAGELRVSPTQTAELLSKEDYQREAESYARKKGLPVDHPMFKEGALAYMSDDEISQMEEEGRERIPSLKLKFKGKKASQEQVAEQVLTKARELKKERLKAFGVLWKARKKNPKIELSEESIEQVIKNIRKAKRDK